MKGFIYFIRCCDFVKVGFSRNPKKRRCHFVTGNPFPLEIVASHPGSKADESALHTVFAAHHHLGDWFRWCPEIEEIAKHGVPHFDHPVVASRGFREVIDLWPSAHGMAADLRVGVEAVRKWRYRDNIPAEYWWGIVNQPIARQAGITSESLLALVPPAIGSRPR